MVTTFHSKQSATVDTDSSSIVQIGSLKNLGFSLRKCAVSLMLAFPSMLDYDFPIPAP